NYNLGGDLKHPKRSVIIWLIMSLAAAKFWKEATTDNPDLRLSDNPFNKTNSDIIVSEALIFFWHSFSLHVVHMKQQQQLTEADKEAVSSAGAVMMRAVKETTGWPIVGVFDARTDEYEHRNKTESSTEVFCRVILRSLGKQAINQRPLLSRRSRK